MVHAARPFLLHIDQPDGRQSLSQEARDAGHAGGLAALLDLIKFGWGLD